MSDCVAEAWFIHIRAWVICHLNNDLGLDTANTRDKCMDLRLCCWLLGTARAKGAHTGDSVRKYKIFFLQISYHEHKITRNCQNDRNHQTTLPDFCKYLTWLANRWQCVAGQATEGGSPVGDREAGALSSVGKWRHFIAAPWCSFLVFSISRMTRQKVCVWSSAAQEAAAYHQSSGSSSRRDTFFHI